MITTIGYAIIFILIFAAFVAGLAIGSFRTKREQDGIDTMKDWLTQKEKDLEKAYDKTINIVSSNYKKTVDDLGANNTNIKDASDGTTNISNITSTTAATMSNKPIK